MYFARTDFGVQLHGRRYALPPSLSTQARTFARVPNGVKEAYLSESVFWHILYVSKADSHLIEPSISRVFEIKNMVKKKRRYWSLPNSFC